MLTEGLLAAQSAIDPADNRIEIFLQQIIRPASVPRTGSDHSSHSTLHFASPTRSQRQKAVEDAAQMGSQTATPETQALVLQTKTASAQSAAPTQRIVETDEPRQEPERKQTALSESDSFLEPFYNTEALANCKLILPDAPPTQEANPFDTPDERAARLQGETPEPFQRRGRAKPRKRDRQGRMLSKSPPPAATKDKSKKRGREQTARSVLAKKTTLPMFRPASKFVNTGRRLTLEQKQTSMSRHAKSGVPDLTFARMEHFADKENRPPSPAPIQEPSNREAPRPYSMTSLSWPPTPPPVHAPRPAVDEQDMDTAVETPFIATLAQVGSMRPDRPLTTETVNATINDMDDAFAGSLQAAPTLLMQRDATIPTMTLQQPMRMHSPASTVLPNIYTHRHRAHQVDTRPHPPYGPYASGSRDWQPVAYAESEYTNANATMDDEEDESMMDWREPLRQERPMPSTAYSDAPVGFGRPFRRG